MDELVLQLVEELIRNRKDRGIAPAHATFVELVTEVRQSLNRLHIKGKIKVGNTINDKYIDIN
ncbi:hypothetical protein [Dyadobacter sp. Leaf189]|uniref:hypothetical protein n=1 Tax=Dyadobacter sp. Leaf189 TaxID=1736295 RepID=UPI0006F5E1E1|nr:hypothetical protein [Dyadobacter sp. Leaf189]KQS33958.1 hypothetical protein ASG33_07975 [Dyadobacter sp. Leaf189]